MFLTVYNVYADSIIFIRRNIFIVAPYIFYSVLNSLLSIWVFEGSQLGRWIQSIVPLLFFLLLETFAIVYVYKRKKIIDSEELLLQTINRFSGKVLLLSVYNLFFFILFIIFWSLFFQKIPVIRNLLIPPTVFVFFGTYTLGLRHLIYYNNTIVVDSIKAGVKELYKDFFLYFFIVLIGILIWRFLSLMESFTWITWPFLPIAKFAGVGSGNEFDWVKLLLSPIWSSLASVTLTYAFILKNKNTKYT